MKLWDNIKSAFQRKDNHTLYTYMTWYGMPLRITNHRFGETIYLNAVQKITEIYAEVIWTPLVDTALYRAWKDFVDRNGERILSQLLDLNKGYTVIGYEKIPDGDNVQWVFYELPETAYSVQVNNNMATIRCNRATQQYYVLKSPTFEQTGKSDRWWCDGFVKLLDAAYNGATTTSERLGAYVVMSPENDNFGGVLNETEKNDLQSSIAKDYGALNNQQQMMVLPRPMKSQVISLAAIDMRLMDKVRSAVLAIADRLKVPANQISLIDGGQAKSFANGTEYREGDLAKYRAFRRLLNSTFYDMATELGLKVTYTIENEPKTVQGQTIEN